MGGHLSSHPYYKTYDECQRSLKRMEVYMNMHVNDEAEKIKVKKMVKLLDEVLTYVPKKYQLTKHELKKLKEEQ